MTRWPRRRISGVALVAVVAACGGSGASTVPMPSAGFRPEDRVILGDFSQVLAIASASDRVYVVYPSAVAIRFPLEQRWDVPRSPDIPGELRAVTAALADPADRSLWMIAGAQWIRYDPFANRWDHGALPGTASAIATDAADPGSILFRTANGWASIPRVGGFAAPSAPPRRPVFPPTVDDALRDLPQLRGLAGRVATGSLLRQGVLTAAAPDPAGHGWFIGTSARGLVFFDRTASDATPIPQGLPGDVVGAVAPASDGVWVATSVDPLHLAGLTLLADDLATARSIAGSPARGLPFAEVYAMAVEHDTLWLATDQGAVRVTPGNEDVERFSVQRGLADQRTFAIAAYGTSIVAATRYGIAAMRGDSGAMPLYPSFNRPSYALAVHGDTLWIGADVGLFAVVPSIDEPRMPEGFRQLSGGTATVLAIGYVADTLVTLTTERLLWRDPATGAWNPGLPLSGTLGTLATASFRGDGVWVAGSLGLGFVRPTTSILQLLTVPHDLPDQVTSVAEHGGYLWVGTRAGLARILLEGR